MSDVTIVLGVATLALVGVIFWFMMGAYVRLARITWNVENVCRAMAVRAGEGGLSKEAARLNKEADELVVLAEQLRRLARPRRVRVRENL